MKFVNINVFIPLLTVVSGIFLFTGCQGGIFDGKSLMVSAEGVKAEALLPDDVWMVFKLGSADQNQIDKINQLVELFPSNFIDYIIDEAAKGFNEDNSRYGIDFKEDILPAIGEKWQLMIAFAGNVSEDEEPVLMAVFMPDDAKKIEEMMKKMPENGKGSEIPIGEYVIYSNETEDAYMVRYEDVILVCNDMDVLMNVLSGKNKGSLLGNKSYQMGADKVGENIGFMFMDPAFVAKQMEENIVSEEEAEQLERMVEILSAVKGEFFALTAEDDGLRIAGVVEVDVSKWRELGLPDVYDVGESYLYKRLPGDNTIFYMESASLNYSVELLIEMYKGIDEMAYVISMMKAALAMQQIDFEKDLMAFMDRGYVFSMQNADGLIPELGLYFDAESSPDGAKKIMNRIYGGIEALLSAEEADEEVLTAIEHKKTDCGDGECYVFEMDFAKLPDEAREEMGGEFADETIYLQYGVDDSNLAFFTMYPGFLDGQYETLEKNVRFEEAMAAIPGFRTQVSFVDVEELTRFVDGWVQYGLKADGAEETEDMSEYEMVMEYLSPFKYVVSGSKTNNNGKVEMEAFIKLSK